MLTRRALLEGAAGAAGGGGDGGHASALAEARRLQSRADVLLRGQGLSRGTVAGRFTRLFADERWLYPDDDAGRDRAVAEMNARLARLRPRLAEAFGGLAMPTATVRRMPAAEVAAGRGGYRTADGYVVDLRDIRARPSWTLPSVAFHETVPGHQLLPASSKLNPEAWATYAEALAAELGAYRGDPLGELGFLHWRLFRMARVVADTGLGRLGWSAERAVAEMHGLQGPSIAFVTVEADVARMVRGPGQYAAQGLGALEIVAKRPAQRAGWPAYHQGLLAA